MKHMKNSKNKFYDKFNDNDKELLISYFESLNDNILLSKKSTKLFNKDFERAIDYYYNVKHLSILNIISILDVNNLGSCYKDDPNYWYPLDNAAKVYPLSQKENWMSVFRLSCYLKEDVVPELFQIALLFTMKRFPTFRTSIRKGLFWHYVDGIKKRFHIYEDKMLPCSYINVSHIGKQSFKAVYFKNRISIECFHILTDGYGGIVFLLTLVANYLKLVGNKVSYNHYVLDPEESPKKEEVVNKFATVRPKTKAHSLVDSRALQVDGKLSSIKPCQIIHFDMHIDEIKRLSKLKNVTITELLLGFIFIVLSYSTSKNGTIKIQVPVNMRKYYPSETLRNFSLYNVISINKKDIKDLDNVLLIIKEQMHSKNNKKSLDETLVYTNKLVNSIKYIPLFIKKPIASMVYGYLGDRVLTTVLSNLGNIDLPIDLNNQIEKMDFVLGTGITNRILFSAITCKNILTLSISKATTNSAVENNLYNMFNKYGINIYVHGSEIYENRK